MKQGHREPSHEVIALRVSSDLAAEIKRHARSDDRTVSGFLRRHLAATLQPSDTPTGDREVNHGK